MIKKWLHVCYAAMMFKERRKKPENWQKKMVYVLNYYLFFIAASFLSNFLIHFDLVDGNNFMVYVAVGILAIIIFSSNKKTVLLFLKKNESRIIFRL